MFKVKSGFILCGLRVPVCAHWTYGTEDKKKGIVIVQYRIVTNSDGFGVRHDAG